MGRVIDALIAYRVLKLLVTPFNRTEAFKMGIIDEKGKVLIKSRDFMKAFPNSTVRANARKAYTMLIRFVFNLKRLVLLLRPVGVFPPFSSMSSFIRVLIDEEFPNNPL